MKTGSAGLSLIKSHEGCRLTAYKDATGTLTIGYGHTGSDVKVGMTITKSRATELLASDLATAERAINVYNFDLNQNQFDALVSLLFNCGTGILKNFAADIKAKNWDAVTARMNKYVYSKGVKLQGLVNRRAEEVELFKKKVS